MLMNPAGLLTGGAIGLIALLFYVGPLLGIPFAWRLVLAMLILMLHFGILLFLKWRTAKKAAVLEKSFDDAAQSQIAQSRPGREQEVEDLKRQLSESIDALKKSKIGKGKGGEGALYVLPWYMLIGPPASGKTTLLQNGGLNFPYLDQGGARSSVRGVGGTRNCDWWFSEEAVLLDTAGRYVLPVEADDTKEWLSFLDLLKKNRGKKPINGLIVGVSISDLVGGTDAQVDEHANRIRVRIDELIQRLGVTFPVYLLFTKCDLVKGFSEFFGDFSKTERAAAWGATIARDRAVRVPAAQLFEEEFDQLAGSVHEMSVARLAEVGRPEVRPEIFFFPLQVTALRGRLSRFAETLFRPNPYQERPIFRGFYFTSGTQEGRPIDQVIHAMLSGFGIRETEGGMYVEPSQTKSYFIENVFSQVVFPDRHMAGPSVEGERRRRIHRTRAFLFGCIGLALASIGLFALSAMNGALLRTAERNAKNILHAVDGRDLDLRLADVRTLDQLRGNLIQMEGRSNPATKFVMLGTYQGEKAEREARVAYLWSLQEGALRPAIPVLAKLLRETDPGKVGFQPYFEAYKAWRVAHDPAQRLRTEDDARTVARALTPIWNLDDPGGRPELQTLLSDQLIFASARTARHPELFAPRDLDLSLDADARAKIRDAWTVDATYPSLIAAGRTAPEVTLQTIPNASNGLTSSATVSGAYTSAGWQGVRGQLDWLDRLRDDWALQMAIPGAQPLRAPLLDRYARDYQTAWLDFLGSIAPPRNASKEETHALLERIAGEESPSGAVLRAVDANSRFENPEGGIVSVSDAFGVVREFMAKPDAKVPLMKLKVPNPGKDAQFTEYQKRVSALAEAFAGGGESGASTAVLELGSWIETTLPTQDPVGGEVARFLQAPSMAVTGTVAGGKAKAAQMDWSSVQRTFNETLANRYPFASSGPDAALADFEAFFAPQGIFWSFYDKALSDKVSDDGAELRDPTFALSDEFRGTLRQASRIRSAFFKPSGEAGFDFSLRTSAPKRDPSSGILVRSSRLDVGGASLVYNMGAPTWTQLRWPGDSPERGASLVLDLGSTASADPLQFEGPWGLYRLLELANTSGGAAPTFRWSVRTNKGPVDVTYEARNLSTYHPLSRELLRFRCPAQITTPR